MKYIYVLDCFTPSRIIIKVDNDVDVSGKIDDILSIIRLKSSECCWLVSDKSLDDEVIPGVITKI